MLGRLDQAGYQITFDNAEADICLVNTCSFIEEARRESVRALVDLAQEGKEIVITGCLAQHFKEELLPELPEARAVVGTGDTAKIVDIVRQLASDSALRLVMVSDVPNDRSQLVAPRLRTCPGAYAYLKIAEGCDHNCSFCIIPLLRGRFRSRPIESLVEEARQLVAQGVKELILVSQDSTYYGLDLYGHMALGELLQALHAIDELAWIRIMYFYPTEATDSLLAEMAALPKVVKYVDIPLQHSHPEMLSAMARPHKPGDVVDRVRALIPDVAVRSTFIVGFPGETESHVEHLAGFIAAKRFDRLGVFTYSRQMEVPSGHMPAQVPERVKRQRLRRIMEIQHRISQERNESLVGRQLTVLVEGFDTDRQMYFGRTQWDAPDIDNQVYFASGGHTLIGDFVEVTIERARPYDLEGSLIVEELPAEILELV